jgi:1,4-alpha-glucan branching enzyme
MRTLVLTSDYVPGNWSGIGTAVASQAAALAHLGVDVEVMVPGSHRAAFSTRDRSGPAVRPLTPRRCPVRPGEFDLVHLHSLPLSGLAFEIRRRFGLPVVYTAHSLLHAELPDTSSGAQEWARLQAAVMRSSDAVIFLSAAERAAAVERDGDLASRSRVLPNGVTSPPSLQPSEPAPPAPIVFAGRFAWSKGIDLVGAIVRRLADSPELRFVLVGGHGDDMGTAVVDDLSTSYQACCRVLGWVDHDRLDALFCEAGLVLVPSRYEPFGMVAVEAMRMGAPVLAADVGGLPEVVTETSGGRLIRSRDPKDWCRAILELMSSPRALAALRCRGPIHVARHYDAAGLASSLLDTVFHPLVPGPLRRQNRNGGVL